MMLRRFGLSAAFLLAAPPALAQAPATDAHAALVEALASEELLTGSFESSWRQTAEAEFRREKDVAGMEGECPGVIKLMIAAMAEPTQSAFARSVSEYRMGLLKLFRARLSVDDARGAAEFYGSDLGRELLAAVRSATVTDKQFDAQRSSVTATASLADLAADKEATNRALLAGGMEPVLLREAGAKLVHAAWLPSIEKIKPEMTRWNSRWPTPISTRLKRNGWTMK